MKTQFHSGRSRDACLNQFLIDQPRLDCAEVANARTRYLLNLPRPPELSSDSRPAIEIDGLFQQVRLFASAFSLSPDSLRLE